MAASIFTMIVLVAIASFSTVFGIKCFQCNSNNNSACTNLEDYGKQRRFLVPTDCEMEFGTAEPFCRKTLLKVLDKEKRAEERVIRSCGWIPHKKECYSTDNEGHQEKVCQCFEDGCNASTSLLPKRWLLSLSVMSFLMLLIRN